MDLERRKTVDIRTLKREGRIVAVSVLLLAAGLITIWLAEEHTDLGGEAPYIALLFAPVIAYAIASGRVSELRAGILEAKFYSVARQAVEVALDRVEGDWERARDVQKAGPAELAQFM